MRLSRRSFLRGCGASLGGLVLPGPLLPVLGGRAGGDRRLLFVFLRGGLDGLHAVIPHGDPDYGPRLRPSLHVPFRAAHDLNGFASLHPALADLLPAFRAGELAIVHRVGLPSTPRSHLASWQALENGDPARPELQEGWLERCLRQQAPVRVLGAAPASSRLLHGSEPCKAPADDRSWGSLFPVSPATSRAGFSAASFPFFRAVGACARFFLECGGTRIAGVELPGWDSHGGEVPAERMAWLALAIRSLRTALSEASVWGDTVVVTLSEFGRATRENAWGGTDHGAAGCLFVAGGAVRGGVYNCDAASWPRGVMLGADGRALLARTDPRALFWEILRDHLGASAAAAESVFPGYAAAGLPGRELGLVRTRWFT